MPRPQTPLTIAEATGAASHNKKRFTGRKQAPQPDPDLGDPPSFFCDIERDLWNEVIGMVAPSVLTKADRILVEITVELLRRKRQLARHEDDHTDPLKPVEIGHLRACLGSMGLTPADRGRVTASNAPKAKDPLDIILGSKGTGKAN